MAYCAVYVLSSVAGATLGFHQVNEYTVSTDWDVSGNIGGTGVSHSVTWSVIAIRTHSAFL